MHHIIICTVLHVHCPLHDQAIEIHHRASARFKFPYERKPIPDFTVFINIPNPFRNSRACQCPLLPTYPFRCTDSKVPKINFVVV